MNATFKKTLNAMPVTLENSQKKFQLPLKLLWARAHFFLSELSKIKKHRLTLKTQVQFRFVSDAEIKKWHRRYFNDPTATDVISFSMREGVDSKSQEDILGDILISVETAQRQAKLYGKSLNEELTLYMIHGVLHLLGYDDLAPRKKKVMDKLQFSLLEKTMREKANEKKKKRA